MRPPRTILFVYPPIVQAGSPVVVQTKLPPTAGATQCLSLLDPAGLEANVSCGAVESRRVVLNPSTPGRNIVRLELFIGDRLLARRDEPLCVLGPDADCEPER